MKLPRVAFRIGLLTLLLIASARSAWAQAPEFTLQRLGLTGGVVAGGLGGGGIIIGGGGVIGWRNADADLLWDGFLAGEYGDGGDDAGGVDGEGYTDPNGMLNGSLLGFHDGYAAGQSYRYKRHDAARADGMAGGRGDRGHPGARDDRGQAHPD